MKELMEKELIELREKGGVNIIVPGCGGDLQDWVDGINEIFEDKAILKDAKNKMKETYAFKKDGITYLVFANIQDIVYVEQLAMWRILSYSDFGIMWLEDYIDNHILKIYDDEEDY